MLKQPLIKPGMFKELYNYYFNTNLFKRKPIGNSLVMCKSCDIYKTPSCKNPQIITNKNISIYRHRVFPK